jgi:hypothetical protein
VFDLSPREVDMAATRDIAKAKKLTPRQEAFVQAFVANGGKVRDAATEAGYATNDSGRKTAYKTLKLPHVQQRMFEVTAEAFGKHAITALATVSKLSKSAKSEYVQLEASKDLLDRAGFKPIDRSQVQVAGDIRVSIDLGD